MLWGELADRADQLRLLALVARSLGVKELDDYEPPSEQIEDMFADDGVDTREERRLRIMALESAGY